MGWRNPNDYEIELLKATRAAVPEIFPLARCLALPPRVEPRMLRNMRLRFVPESPAELESMLWFSGLIAVRTTREIVFHQGVAKALADEWRASCCNPEDAIADQFAPLWQYLRELTRHWSRQEQLERDLRYFALINDQESLRRGLQDILRHLCQEKDQRIEWSRLVKRCLPILYPTADRGTETPLEEAGWLAQFASLSLADAGVWASLGAPKPLPSWLARNLPSVPKTQRLGAELRFDEIHGQILHITEADASSRAIEVPAPLPALLHIAGKGSDGAWHILNVGGRVRIQPPAQSVVITTREGKQWRLETGVNVVETANLQAEPLTITYVAADADQAQTIARWLRSNGFTVELVRQSDTPLGTSDGAGHSKAVYLWTRAAQQFWQSRPFDENQAPNTSLILRTDDVEAPAGQGAGAGRVLDWHDWASPESSAESKKLLELLHRWRTEGAFSMAEYSQIDAETSLVNPAGDRTVSPFRVLVSHSSRLDNVEHDWANQDHNWKLLSDTCSAIREQYGDRVDVLCDQDGLLPVEDWNHRFNLWIVECHAAIILLSNRTIEKSKWLTNEASPINWRLENDGHFLLVPILLDSKTELSDLAKDFSSILNLDTYSCIRATNVREIMAGIIEVLGTFGSRSRSLTPLEWLSSRVMRLIGDQEPPQLQKLLNNVGSGYRFGMITPEQVALELSRQFFRSAIERPDQAMNDLMVLTREISPRPSKEIVFHVYKAIRSLWIGLSIAGQVVSAFRSRKLLIVSSDHLLYSDPNLSTHGFGIERLMERSLFNKELKLIRVPIYIDIDSIKAEVIREFLGPGVEFRIEQNRLINHINKDTRIVVIVVPFKDILPDPRQLHELATLYQEFKNILVACCLEATNSQFPMIASDRMVIINLNSDTEQSALLAEFQFINFLERNFGDVGSDGPSKLDSE